MAKIRKLGRREETIGYGPTKEKWEGWNRDREGGIGREIDNLRRSR